MFVESTHLNVGVMILHISPPESLEKGLDKTWEHKTHSAILSLKVKLVFRFHFFPLPIGIMFLKEPFSGFIVLP